MYRIHTTNCFLFLMFVKTENREI